MTLTSTNATYNPLAGLVAPLSKESAALQKAHVTNGIREVIFDH